MTSNTIISSLIVNIILIVYHIAAAVCNHSLDLAVIVYVNVKSSGQL